jgi:hypothetical protein
MTTPARHGAATATPPLLTPAEALDEPMPIRDILARMRHDGCGGLAGKAELLSDIEGVSSRPVRRSC